MRLKLIPLLAAIITLAFASAAQADTFTVDGLTVDTYGQPTAGRVFSFHVLGGSRQGNAADPTTAGLVALGYQVIVTDEPYDQPAANQPAALRAAFLADGTAGQTYRNLWAKQTHDLIAAADARYGKAPRLLMQGVSWGGFSALLAACSNPEVDGYVATIPATDPNGLPEWADVPLDNLKLWNGGCSDRLAAMPGFIAWGNQDTRVGTSGTPRLLSLLGDSATGCEYPMGHQEPLVAVHGMVRWVDGERDCLPYAADPVAPAASVPAASTPAPAAAPAAAAAPVPAVRHAPAVKRSRCNRSNHCENIVRRHKLFHVYNRHGKHPRWVYVRKARR